MRKNLKSKRKQCDLTQAQVAKLLGMQVTSYQRIEAGTRKGDIELWLKICDLYSIDTTKELRRISELTIRQVSRVIRKRS